MTRDSRLWLWAAGGVAVAVAAVVLIFGYNSPPSFPSLSEQSGMTIEGTVAYMEFGREDCVRLLDVASGSTEDLYCDNWVWIEGWDEDGNLAVHADDGRDQTWVLDPDTGEVLDSADSVGPPPRRDSSLRSRSIEGRVTLTHGVGESAVTLIDVEAPGNYGFHGYGITADGAYAWVSDSEDRLLLVTLDGNAGPWLVAEGISDPHWR